MDRLGIAALAAALLLIAPVWALGAICLKATDCIQSRRARAFMNR
jgi:hypothetical protein